MWDLFTGTISIIFWISFIFFIIVLATMFSGGDNTGNTYN